MEIIADTNIWYNIGNGLIDAAVIGEGNKLIATFISIDEFSRTANLIERPKETRNAIQSMFKYSNKHAILEPPLFYLKKLENFNYAYDIALHQESILTFTEKIARGYGIELSKRDEYRIFCESRKANLQSVADIFNIEARKLKENIKEKGKHRKENSIPLNRQLISLFVEKQTGEGLSKNFDWTQIELFEKSLKVFLNALETGAMVMKPNDWYDLFIMVYVSPERKYWTRDCKWLDIIKTAGMENYLFE